MFESKEHLAGEIRDLLGTLRELSGGTEVCLLDSGGVLFETPEGGSLAGFLRQRSQALFAIPESMAGDGPQDDIFEEWKGSSVLLAFVNRRVAMALSCPNAEEAGARLEEPLKILVDRLLRFDSRYRLDPQGRGLFVGRPRLDLVAVGEPGCAAP